jgi:hypothetical protein
MHTQGQGVTLVSLLGTHTQGQGVTLVSLLGTHTHGQGVTLVSLLGMHNQDQGVTLVSLLGTHTQGQGVTLVSLLHMSWLSSSNNSGSHNTTESVDKDQVPTQPNPRKMFKNLSVLNSYRVRVLNTIFNNISAIS